jgi:hypothetical protein
MNQKVRRPNQSSMENEIIVSVIVLYLLLAVAMLTVHHMQPEGQETVTSSTLPSHGHFRGDAPTPPPAEPAPAPQKP